MRPQPHPGIGSFAILLQQGLALARRYAKMALHGITATGSDKLLHLPSLEVKHFPFNVVLFRNSAVDSKPFFASSACKRPKKTDSELEGGMRLSSTGLLV